MTTVVGWVLNLDAELESLATRGASAAAPVAGLGETPAALLLVYPTKAGRPLRPRTIAVLGEVAAKGRLADLAPVEIAEAADGGHGGPPQG